MRVAVLLGLLVACGDDQPGADGGDGSTLPDFAGDMATPEDLPTAQDLSVAADLSLAADLFVAIDSAADLVMEARDLWRIHECDVSADCPGYPPPAPLTGADSALCIREVVCENEDADRNCIVSADHPAINVCARVSYTPSGAGFAADIVVERDAPYGGVLHWASGDIAELIGIGRTLDHGPGPFLIWFFQ